MIQNSAQMNDRKWIQALDEIPPSFYYPNENRPHLHITSSFINNQPDPPWFLAYLGYTDANGQHTVIYKRAIQGVNPEIRNRGAIANIPANLQAEAQWAYDNLSDPNLSDSTVYPEEESIEFNMDSNTWDRFKEKASFDLLKAFVRAYLKGNTSLSFHPCNEDESAIREAFEAARSQIKLTKHSKGDLDNTAEISLTAMKQTQAEEVLNQLINKISTLFYNGKPFTIFGGTCPVVPQIKVEPGAIPNGNLAPMEQSSHEPYAPISYGLAVSQGVLDIDNDTALKFVLGHELGHGFSEVLLTKVGLQGVSGFVTEVVADLGAAYLLSQAGSTWDEILNTVDQWSKYQIFDPDKSGDHPPGEKRAEYVRSLKRLIVDDHDHHSFEDAVKGICMSLQPS